MVLKKWPTKRIQNSTLKWFLNLNIKTNVLVFYKTSSILYQIILFLRNLQNFRYKSIFFSQTKDTIIRFSHTTDGTTDCVHFWCSGHSSGFWVNISNVQLDWGMILSIDNSIAWCTGMQENKIQNSLTKTRVNTISLGSTSQQIHQRRFPLLFI